MGTTDDKTIGTKGSRDVLYHFFTPTGNASMGETVPMMLNGGPRRSAISLSSSTWPVIEDHRLPNPDLWVGILAIYAGSGVLALIGVYVLYKARVRRREVT